MNGQPVVHALAEEPEWGSVSEADIIVALKAIGVPLEGVLNRRAEDAVKHELRKMAANDVMVALMTAPYPIDFALLLREVFLEACTVMRIDGDRKPACHNRFAIMFNLKRMRPKVAHG